MELRKIYLNERKSVSSTMVYLKTLFCTMIIDAHEGHNVSTF